MAGKIARAETLHLQVQDVMARRPKTLPVSATVGDVRRMFEDPRHRTAVLADDEGKFVGSIDREDLPHRAGGDELAAGYSSRTAIPPYLGMRTALELMDRPDMRRLVVVDHETGLLRGLLCLSAGGESFCQD